MDYSLYYKIIIIGFAILIVAIIMNLMASVMGITTWHTFFLHMKENGLVSALKNAGIFSLFFMLIVYPFLLGTTAYYTIKLLF